mgnify:CR=1 FL=1
MKYCQGPLCHTYDTQDRKRGPKGNKVNQTRRRSSFYYLRYRWGRFGDQGDRHIFYNMVTHEERNITEQQFNDDNYDLNT